MKALNAIQILAKIGKVFSKIVFVFCIVGFCLCIAGIVSLALGAEAFKIGSVTITSIIEKNAEMNVPTLYAAMAIGILFCAAEAVLCKFAERYFKNELADGTPFTQRGAGELFRLGILTIVLPLAVVIVCAIGVSVAQNILPEIAKVSTGDFASVGLGVVMLILSLFCQYGAELREGENKEKENAI